MRRKAFDLQPSPKYTDASECIAHIYELQGKYKLAIKEYENYIQILNDEWDITEGELVDRGLREIDRLNMIQN